MSSTPQAYSPDSKKEALRNVWIQRAASHIVRVKEANALADIMKPDMEAKVKEWIKQEVEKQLNQQRLERVIQDHVTRYCKDIFEGGQMEDYMSIKVDERQSDEAPYDKVEFEEL